MVKVSSGRGSLQQYREEFKKEAVEYSLSPGKTVEEVTRDLGIAESNLRRWRASTKSRENCPSLVMVSKNSHPRKRKTED